MASNWPAIVSVKDSQGEYSLRLKASGDGRLIQIPPPVDGRPNLQPGSLFASFPDIEIDGISSGNAYLAGDIAGGVPSTIGRWLAASTTLSKDSLATGSTLFDWPSQGTNPGGAVVTHYFAQGEQLSDSYRGYTMLEVSTAQMGINPHSDDDIVAIDYGLGVHHVGGGSSNPLLFPRFSRVYFSVTSSWASKPAQTAGLNRPTFRYTTWPPTDWDGAAIYYMEWNSTATAWEGPYVYATREDLGLVGEFPVSGVEVDGVDVDELNMALVFSVAHETITALPNKKQLMIAKYLAYDPDTSVDPAGSEINEFMATDASGQNPLPVTQRTGVVTDTPTPDEVSGVCTWDPDGGNVTSWVVTPVLPYAGATGGQSSDFFGMSMIRWVGSSSFDFGSFQFTGWGGATPQPCTLVVEARVADAANTSVPWVQVGRISRTPSDDEVQFRFSRIPNLGLSPSWGSQPRMSFRARLEDVNGAVLATTLINELLAYNQ